MGSDASHKDCRYVEIDKVHSAGCGPHSFRFASHARLRSAAPRKDRRGVDLISDALPFGRLWYVEVSDAIDYAKFRSRSCNAVIRVYDEGDNVIETHEHMGDLREP